jgi:hypothetical protein
MSPEDANDPRIDISLLLNNNQVGFTQSARRHRIGRARVMSVLATTPFVNISTVQAKRARLLFVGRDWTGRLLEVIAVMEEHRVVIIHAMDARPSVVRRHSQRRSDGTS